LSKYFDNNYVLDRDVHVTRLFEIWVDYNNAGEVLGVEFLGFTEERFSAFKKAFQFNFPLKEGGDSMVCFCAPIPKWENKTVYENEQQNI